MDTISQMMITIKNGGHRGKESVLVPYSNLKNNIALCLKKEGFIEEVTKKTRKRMPVLEIKLMYAGNTPKINEVKRISKPSRRVYYGVKEIYPVRNNTGLFVLSTPKGILAGDEARKEQVGGEALFKIW
jgi:small subunit ribosomal protein S8